MLIQSTSKRKIVKEMIGYYIEVTESTPMDYIVNVQKSKRQPEDEQEYAIWLAGEIDKVLSSRGILLKDIVSYEVIREVEDIAGKEWLKQEIEKRAEGYSYKYDLMGLDIAGFENKTEIDFLNVKDLVKGIEPYTEQMGETFSEVRRRLGDVYYHIDGTGKGQYTVTQETMLLQGYPKEVAEDKGMQVMYRVKEIKYQYKLERMRVGILLNIKSLKNSKGRKYIESFFKEFKYIKGYYFKPGLIGRGGYQRGLVYLIVEVCENEGINSIELQEMKRTTKGIMRGEQKLIRLEYEGMYDWMSTGQEKEAIAYTYASKNKLRMMHRYEVVGEEPSGGYIKVTEQNLLKVAASNAVREVMREREGFKPMQLQSPETRREGYTEWLASAVVLFIYGPGNQIRKESINRLYPISKWYVERVAGQEEIREIENEVVMRVIEGMSVYLSEDAQDLKTYCDAVMLKFIQNRSSRRVALEGDNSVDLSMNEIIRYMPSLVNEQEYNKKVEKIREEVYKGVYKYGFISI